MLIAGIWFNVDAFKGCTLENFKAYYILAGYDSTGLTAEQLAEKLGIIKQKAEKKPAE